MTPREPAFDPQELLAQLPFVRGVARELLRERAAAEDVAQEVAIAALAGTDAAAPRRKSLRPWLVGVTRNLARMFRRGEQRRESRERAAALHEAQPSSVDESVRFEALRRVVLAMERLDAGDRTLLVRRFYDEWPPRRIAAELRLPVNTVRTRLARALERLRRELIDGGGRDGAAKYPALLLALVAPPPALVAAPPVASIRPPLASAALPVATGVVLMSAKLKLAIAAVVVAIAAAGVAWWPREAKRARSGVDEARASAAKSAEPDAREVTPATRAREAPADAETTTPMPTNRRRIVALHGRLVPKGGEPGRWTTPLTVTAAIERASGAGLLAPPAPERLHSSIAVASDGSFNSDLELDDLTPRIGRLTLTGADPAFASFRRWFAVPNGTTPRLEWSVEIHVFPAAPVRGRIVDEAGAPIADGAVGVFAVTGRSVTLLGEGTAGADGEFALGVTPPGRCFVVASQRRSGPELGMVDATLASGSRLLPAVAELTTEVAHETDVGELVLRPGVTIRGRVEWFAHGPVAGAIVDAKPVREKSTSNEREDDESLGAFTNAPLTRSIYLPSGVPANVSTVTDEHGEFVLSGLAAGPTRVSVRSLPDGMLHSAHRTNQQVTAPADGVVLRVEAAIIDYEVTSGGKAVEGAIVSTGQPNGSWRATRNGRMETGADGRVGSVVPAGSACGYGVRATGFRDASGTFTAPAAGERKPIPIELEPLKPSPSLIIHLVDEQGVPVTVAAIQLESKPDPTLKSESAVDIHGGEELAIDGRFVVNDAKPGDHRLQIKPGGRFIAGDGCYAELTRDVTIRAGVVETIELVALPAGRLRVAARDATGRFLRAHFSLCGEAGQTVEAQPIEVLEDANGGFLFSSTSNDLLATSDFSRIDPPLAPGRYFATFTLAGFETQTVPVEIKPLQPTDLEVILAPAR